MRSLAMSLPGHSGLLTEQDDGASDGVEMRKHDETEAENMFYIRRNQRMCDRSGRGRCGVWNLVFFCRHLGRFRT